MHLSIVSKYTKEKLNSKSDINEKIISKDTTSGKCSEITASNIVYDIVNNTSFNTETSATIHISNNMISNTN